MRQKIRQDDKRLGGYIMKIRQFKTGATRNAEEGKPDYEGFLSRKSFKTFCDEYMNKHRITS